MHTHFRNLSHRPWKRHCGGLPDAALIGHAAVRPRRSCPVDSPPPADAQSTSAHDVRRWREITEITGETDTPPESIPADDEPVTYTEAQLGGSCRYGI